MTRGKMDQILGRALALDEGLRTGRWNSGEDFAEAVVAKAKTFAQLSGAQVRQLKKLCALHALTPPRRIKMKNGIDIDFIYWRVDQIREELHLITCDLACHRVEKGAAGESIDPQLRKLIDQTDLALYELTDRDDGMLARNAQAAAQALQVFEGTREEGR